MHLKTLISKAKLNENDLVAVYCYGSRVYGNYNAHSDYDFIVVTKNKPNEQFSDNLININFYTPEEHQARLDAHEISALECLFLAPEYIWVEKQKFKFNLDLSKLRHSLSAKSSNSWVKAKKKLTVEKDYDLNIGRKSLFHAMRIIEFGIQIGIHRRIWSYDYCNELYNEIMNCYTWDQMFDNYKKKYNELNSRFKAIAPKK